MVPGPAAGEGDGTRLPPDEAFATLGNETRMEILQVLGEADGPLSFSELYDRVEYDTTANFSYHLDKLEGHFVRRSEAGYELRQSGKRVVEAVLSGAVTEAPVLESTTEDQWPCPYCGTPIETGYHHDRVWLACPACPGTYGASLAPGGHIASADLGFIGHLRLPPAAVQGRTAAEVLEVGATWGHLDFLALASGICPRCAASVDRTVTVCEGHDASEGLCTRCDCRHAVQIRTRCTNCIHEEAAPFLLGRLVATREYVSFLADHGINPVTPSLGSEFPRALVDYEEEVRSVDPFEVRFALTLGDETLVLTVDDDLSVVESSRRPAAEPASRPESEPGLE